MWYQPGAAWARTSIKRKTDQPEFCRLLRDSSADQFARLAWICECCCCVRGKGSRLKFLIQKGVAVHSPSAATLAAQLVKNLKFEFYSIQGSCTSSRHLFASSWSPWETTQKHKVIHFNCFFIFFIELWRPSAGC